MSILSEGGWERVSQTPLNGDREAKKEIEEVYLTTFTKGKGRTYVYGDITSAAADVHCKLHQLHVVYQTPLAPQLRHVYHVMSDTFS